jgi:hypothetical protein
MTGCRRIAGNATPSLCQGRAPATRKPARTPARYIRWVLRSPWLGPLAITIAGVLGFMLSDDHAGEVVIEDVTVTIRETRETGARWDFGGGLPDPRIRVEQAGLLIAQCPAVKDRLTATCAVNARVNRSRGEFRVSVVDADASDDDAVGEAVLDLGHAVAGTGSLVSVETRTHGGETPWERFRALWIALAIGIAIAGGLAVYRRS